MLTLSISRKSGETQNLVGVKPYTMFLHCRSGFGWGDRIRV